MRSVTILIVVLAGCGSDAAPSSVRVNPATIVLGVGQSIDVEAFLVVEGSSERAGDGVEWSSDDGAVATVTAGGDGSATVVGVASGTAAVAAAVSALRGTAMVTVRGVPMVSETSPTDGATAVARPVDVELTFSLPMEDDTVTAQSAAGACSGSIQLSRDGFTTCEAFAGSVSLSGGNMVATLTPMQLDADTTFKLRVTTAAHSSDGVALAADFTQPTGFTTAPSEPCATGLVISQIYGGGGGTGSPFTNDFIELHNAGATPVALGGMALHYAGAGGTGAWGSQALPSVTVPAGGYYLMQEAAGATPSAALPAPDFVPGNPIGLSPTAGKVALTSTTTALDGICPGQNVIDRVGYGGSNCYEGAAPAPAPSNTTGVQRRGLGCIDATHNGTDFVTAAPAPRNGATTPSVCSCFLR